jgi:hypothetical protein
LTVSENDLKEQLADLDWGTGAGADAPGYTTPAPGASEKGEAAAPAPSGAGGLDGLDALDVAVAGVKPARQRKARTARVKRQPNAEALLDAARDGQTVEANAPSGATRRSRTTAPDVLTSAGEGPAVIALFDSMWKEVGSKLARGIGRPKASRQDAALGWYMLLLAMRERDAKK